MDDTDDATDDDDDDAPAVQQDELKEYLAMPKMKFKNDWGVLEFWRDNQEKFPNHPGGHG